MRNNVNDFNSAKVNGATDSKMQLAHNTLIDILQRQIKILQADIANGITVDTTGMVQLGLASATTAGALSATDWGTFNNKQDQSNELDAIAALSDAPGLMKKTGDGTYSMLEGAAENDFIVAGADLAWTVKTLAQVQTLIGAATPSDAIVYAIALG